MIIPTAVDKAPMLIDGELVESESGEWLESVNPADEEMIGHVPAASAEDVRRAVEAAGRAFPEWAALNVKERARYLKEVAARLAERSEEVLRVEVIDTGNTIGRMRGDVGKGVDVLEYYAGLGLEMKGETVPSTPQNLHLSVREPYGVVGRIIPFNHPIMFAASRMAAPLMAGNTIVIKPSEQSPLSATMLGEICQEVLPPGVVNIVTGLGEVAGDALVRHPNVKRIAFTGSVKTGMAIQRAAAEVAVKHVTLELGGKNPMIVFPDADLSKAIPSAVAGMNFAWQGQSCGSVSRLFLHDSIYDEVLAEIRERVEAIRLGDPLDESSGMGPINSKAQYEKVGYYIEAGKEDGARLVTGGSRPEGGRFERGYWMRPTVFADVTPEMRIFREEIFGPVLSVIRWSEVEEVIEMANSVEYGLTAAVWTERLGTAFDAARRVKSGYVWINGVSAHYPGCSFGGVKNSGIGREEGLEELLSYTESKAIHVHL
jgi:betaine-aldehyde dehydrogenase